MGFGGLFPWGLLLQALAIVHFVRRRPDAYWLWVILFFPASARSSTSSSKSSRMRRCCAIRCGACRAAAGFKQLEAIILDNPAVGNLEELADLYLEDKKFARARELYDRVITPRTDSPDPYYRRGIAAIELKDLRGRGRRSRARGGDQSEVRLPPRHRPARARLARNSVRPRKPMPCFSRRRRSPRSPRPITTTRRSSSRKAARRKRTSGPTASSRRSRRCRAIYGVASGRGSARRRRS